MPKQGKSLKLKLGHNLQIIALAVTFGWDLLSYFKKTQKI